MINKENDWDVVAVILAKGFLIMVLGLGILGFVQDFVL